MRVLIVKVSSLGDVINTLPALTDAGNHSENIQFDWVVEQAFAQIPTFHPLVKNVIPINLRKWRKHPLQAIYSGEILHFLEELRNEKYDLIIDAQGLIKSGFLTFLSRGLKCGYDKHSAWEPIATYAYDKKFAIHPDQHAITRIRQLFAKCFDYPVPETLPDCGINKALLPTPSYQEKFCLFFHGTARPEKCWPEKNWIELISLMNELNYKILLPWGNPTEKERADRLAWNQPNVEVLPKLSLTELAGLIAHSTANVAVDTGLGHLAAALNSPTISLYGPTKPELNGTIGANQKHLKAIKLENISALNVYQELRKFL